MPTGVNEALRAAKYCLNVWNATKDFNYYQAYMKLYWLGTADPEEYDQLAEETFSDFIPCTD
jgi:hypothetical protein